MTRHYSRKADGNQAEIVAEWEKWHCLWVSTGRQGDGCPDGFLLHKGQWLAIEIKQKDGKLKPKQKELHELVEYHHGKIHVIRTLKQAMELIGVIYAD